MSYTLDDFNKEAGLKYLKSLPLEEVLSYYSADEVLSHYSASERLKGIPREEIEAYLEQLKKQKTRKTNNQHQS